MFEKSFGVLFYLKRPKNSTSGVMPIYLRITVNGTPCELCLKRSCSPDRWNTIAQRAKGTTEESRSINSFLDMTERQIHNARVRLIEQQKPVTSLGIKNILTGEEDKPRMLLEQFGYHNSQLATLVGKEYTTATLKRYKAACEHTRNFIKSKYNLPDLNIKDLNFEFISEFEFWLKSIRNCNHNTTIKYISNLRKIVNNCIRNGWLSRDPFVQFKRKKREVERNALSLEELEVIASKNFKSERLNVIRDVFVFACYTGLAYIDVKQLKRTQINIGVDGQQWIFTRRQKTDTASRIPLLPVALEIIDRYKDHPVCSNKDTVLPVPSNQKVNAYLKEIMDVCGISMNLTFHIARHTFATTITLNNNVPIETVSKMLGHTNLRTTQLYAKVLDRKVSQDMAVLREKLTHVK